MQAPGLEAGDAEINDVLENKQRVTTSKEYMDDVEYVSDTDVEGVAEQEQGTESATGGNQLEEQEEAMWNKFVEDTDTVEAVMPKKPIVPIPKGQEKEEVDGCGTPTGPQNYSSVANRTTNVESAPIVDEVVQSVEFVKPQVGSYNGAFVSENIAAKIHIARSISPMAPGKTKPQVGSCNGAFVSENIAAKTHIARSVSTMAPGNIKPQAGSNDGALVSENIAAKTHIARSISTMALRSENIAAKIHIARSISMMAPGKTKPQPRSCSGAFVSENVAAKTHIARSISPMAPGKTTPQVRSYDGALVSENIAAKTHIARSVSTMAPRSENIAAKTHIARSISTMAPRSENIAAKTHIAGSISAMAPENNEVLDLVKVLAEPVAAIATELREAMGDIRRELHSVVGAVQRDLVADVQAPRDWAAPTSTFREVGKDSSCTRWDNGRDERKTAGRPESPTVNDMRTFDGGNAWRSSAKLPPFLGSETWEVWINRFEDVARRRQWDEDEKLDALLPRLQGKVGEFVYLYGQLPKHIRNDYQLLVRELKNRFRKIETPNNWL